MSAILSRPQCLLIIITCNGVLVDIDIVGYVPIIAIVVVLIITTGTVVIDVGAIVIIIQIYCHIYWCCHHYYYYCYLSLTNRDMATLQAR